MSTRLGDDDNLMQNPGTDPNSSEELGAWGVPERLEDNTNPNAGFPGGIGMPGVFSGDVSEQEDDDLPATQLPPSNAPR